MGYDIARFQGEVDEELICPICSGVLEDPLQAPICEHVFCKTCINEWLSRQFSCPIDRGPITRNELKPVPRILRNLLSRLLITCDNTSLGCTAVVKLERLEIHHQGCAHNPNRPVPCERCRLIVPKDELEDHNCIREVSLMLQRQQRGINGILLAINEIRKDIGLLKSCIQENIGAAGVNPYVPTVLELLEEDETIRWLNSLQRARVRHWGAMISNPESALQEIVRRALTESGCPSHLTAELMGNAHERRWPSGLSTLETRQTNRRYYKDYVCKRIPGREAVVVMAIDNRHMNDDMVLEPGLVMIFAHSIE
ncbi:E3 ubiquitin-protein ligase NRDP1 [Araneus ventricosus]|uniref:E3 ubiquitin-protein ligase NRDP1 n=1 Tax=Araneus ventricosus TaxID=182803 RepID=A0A4Y2BYB7_ARAVE|nr:E3 ubiquitin-protein ligase NRDP1 [Araneus ventricosus]